MRCCVALAGCDAASAHAPWPRPLSPHRVWHSFYPPARSARITSPPRRRCPTKFKELKGWKLATPSDALDRGDWWSALPRQEARSPAAAGRGLQSDRRRAGRRLRAGARPHQRSASLPVSDSDRQLHGHAHADADRTSAAAADRASAPAGGGGGGGGTYSTTYMPALNGSWDLDVWGKVRRQIESNTVCRAGQRRRPRQRQTVPAGDARHRLFQSARRGCAARSARPHGRGIQGDAADRAEPSQRRLLGHAAAT